MPKYGKMPWLNYYEVRLLSYRPHLITANKRHHLIPSIVHKHHWSRASILGDANLSIGKIQVLYSFIFVGIEIRDFQKWLSRLCIAAQVIPLRRMMSAVLCVDKWMREPRYTNTLTTAICWPWTVMVDGSLTNSDPPYHYNYKAWTFDFCQFTSNPSKVASLAIVSSTGTRSSSNSASRETSLCTTYMYITTTTIFGYSITWFPPVTKDKTKSPGSIRNKISADCTSNVFLEAQSTASKHCKSISMYKS